MTDLKKKKHDFACDYHNIELRHTLSNKVIVMKHHRYNLYHESHKLVGAFHLLDIDLNHVN